MTEIDVSPIHQKSGSPSRKNSGVKKPSWNLFVSLPPNNSKTPKRPFISTKVSPTKFPQSVKRGTKTCFFLSPPKSLVSEKKKSKVERKNKFEEKKTKSLISKSPKWSRWFEKIDLFNDFWAHVGAVQKFTLRDHGEELSWTSTWYKKWWEILPKIANPIVSVTVGAKKRRPTKGTSQNKPWKSKATIFWMIFP